MPNYRIELTINTEIPDDVEYTEEEFEEWLEFELNGGKMEGTHPLIDVIFNPYFEIVDVEKN